MARFRKFWSLARPEKLSLCEAGVVLALSALGVRTIAFRHIDRFLRACWNDRPWETANREDDIALVERSVDRATRLLPWQSQCLSRSIATYVMLRRRGVSAALFAGVRLAGNSSLLAHAWVDTGRGATIRDSEAHHYATLVRIGREPADGGFGGEPAHVPSRSPGAARAAVRPR